MTPTFMVVAIIAGLLFVLASLIVRESVRTELRRIRPFLPDEIAPVVRAITPEAPPPTAPAPPSPKKADDFVQITFVTEKGKPLGTTKMPRTSRRPTITHIGKHGFKETFVAESGEGRTFRYRRVGRERTH